MSKCCLIQLDNSHPCYCALSNNCLNSLSNNCLTEIRQSHIFGLDSDFLWGAIMGSVQLRRRN